jgi:ubiquinone/menaquinone biosynthesis C-methylase UbiE
LRIQPFVEAGLCSFEVGNLLQLPYPDQSFEIVISFRLLPHVSQWRRLLSELARVARRAVILDYPEIASVNYIAPSLFRFKKRLEGNTRPFTCFRERQLLDAFQPSGFERSARYAEFFLPMVLHRKLNHPGWSAGVEKLFRGVGLTDRFGSPVILKMARKGG